MHGPAGVAEAQGRGFQQALKASSRAGGDYGAGRGPAAAAVQAVRHLAWSAFNARQWRTDAGAGA
eukprot:2241951-Lingulodinium_polyedra.AAC.1